MSSCRGAALVATASVTSLWIVGTAAASRFADTSAGVSEDTLWQPAEVEVQPGDTVTSTFEDGGRHSKLKRGRDTVEVQALDPDGNRSNVAKKGFKLT